MVKTFSLCSHTQFQLERLLPSWEDWKQAVIKKIAEHPGNENNDELILDLFLWRPDKRSELPIDHNSKQRMAEMLGSDITPAFYKSMRLAFPDMEPPAERLLTRYLADLKFDIRIFPTDLTDVLGQNRIKHLLEDAAALRIITAHRVEYTNDAFIVSDTPEFAQTTPTPPPEKLKF